MHAPYWTLQNRIPAGLVVDPDKQVHHHRAQHGIAHAGRFNHRKRQQHDRAVNRHLHLARTPAVGFLKVQGDDGVPEYTNDKNSI